MKKLIVLFLLNVSCNAWMAAQRVTGLLGAFPPEMVVLQKQVENKKDTLIQHIRFTTGMLKGKAVVLAQTGVGKVNAAITTTLMIEHFKPTEIIFSGIAGGIDRSLTAGDIIIATKLAYHDYGTLTDQGMVYSSSRSGVTMEPNPFYFDCDTSLVNKAVIAVGKINFEKLTRNEVLLSPVVKKGIIVTGDVFVSAEAVTQRLRNELNASATEMEGAAIAQTCWQQKIPFLVIRSLSDKANNKARKDMAGFMEVAAKNAAMLVIGIVGEL